MTGRLVVFPTLVLSLSAALAGQDPGAILPALRVPVHATPEGEVWAAGPGYKVSFHDGVSFYPLVGADREHLPLHWRTERVRVGLRDVVPRRAARPQWTEDRVEFRHESVVEAYDLREDGVEQTWVLLDKPSVAGDLVIEGRVDTPLRAEPVADRYGALSFRDDAGQPIVDYGAATAFDAAGRRTAMRTSFDGERVRLTLPAEWLRGAAYPVTVDPLLSAVAIENRYPAWGVAGRPEVMTVASGGTHSTLVFFSRPWSASDWDCFAYVCDTGFANATEVYQDISAAYSSRDVACTFVGATQRWALAHDQQSTEALATSFIRVVYVPLGQQAPVATTDLFPIQPGNTVVRPDLGGSIETSTSGDDVFAVYEELDPSGRSAIYGAVINTTSAFAQWRFPLDSDPFGSSAVRAYPSVNQVSFGGSSHWIAVWQSRQLPSSPWTIRGALISPWGAITTAHDFGPSTTKHAVRPRVAGDRGLYLLTYALSNDPVGDFGDQLYTERFDWDDLAPAPTHVQRRMIADAQGVNRYRNSDLAHDWRNPRMYGLAWETNLTFLPSIEAARVGSTGAVVERQVVTGNAIAPAITYESRPSRFIVAYGSTAPPHAVNLQRFSYDPAARNTIYGMSCGGRIHSTYVPHAGLSSYHVRLDQAPPNESAWLLIAGQQASAPLAGIGMAGCTLYVGGAFFPVGTVTDATGFAFVPIPLPDAPLFVGDFYTQWLHTGAGTAIGLGATQGMHVQVR